MRGWSPGFCTLFNLSSDVDFPAGRFGEYEEIEIRGTSRVIPTSADGYSVRYIEADFEDTGGDLYPEESDQFTTPDLPVVDFGSGGLWEATALEDIHFPEGDADRPNWCAPDCTGHETNGLWLIGTEILPPDPAPYDRSPLLRCSLDFLRHTAEDGSEDGSIEICYGYEPETTSSARSDTGESQRTADGGWIDIGLRGFPSLKQSARFSREGGFDTRRWAFHVAGAMEEGNADGSINLRLDTLSYGGIPLCAKGTYTLSREAASSAPGQTQ